MFAGLLDSIQTGWQQCLIPYLVPTIASEALIVPRDMYPAHEHKWLKASLIGSGVWPIGRKPALIICSCVSPLVKRRKLCNIAFFVHVLYCLLGTCTPKVAHRGVGFVMQCGPCPVYSSAIS